MLMIYKTQDYDQFKRFESNRPVRENALVEIIKKRNLLESRPILVNKDLQIVDGQHRLAAARILNLPIYYIIDDKLTEEDISIINANQRSWNALDFLHFYARKKVPAYVFIEKIHKEYKLLLHLIITCVDKTNFCYKRFTSGTIKVQNEEQLKESFEIFSEIYELCKDICKNKQEICTRSMRILWSFIHHEKYDHEEFLEKCKKNPDKVIQCFSYKKAKNIKQELCSIINIRRKKEDKIE